jgi:hypothetical protein
MAVVILMVESADDLWHAQLHLMVGCVARLCTVVGRGYSVWPCVCSGLWCCALCAVCQGTLARLTVQLCLVLLQGGETSEADAQAAAALARVCRRRLKAVMSCHTLSTSSTSSLVHVQVFAAF